MTKYMHPWPSHPQYHKFKNTQCIECLSTLHHYHFSSLELPGPNLSQHDGAPWRHGVIFQVEWLGLGCSQFSDSSQRCSVGLKSGLCAGHSGSSNLHRADFVHRGIVILEQDLTNALVCKQLKLPTTPCAYWTSHSSFIPSFTVIISSTLMGRYPQEFGAWL